MSPNHRASKLAVYRLLEEECPRVIPEPSSVRSPIATTCNATLSVLLNVQPDEAVGVVRKRKSDGAMATFF